MSKKRVYELAREVGLESKIVIKKLKDIGIAVASHQSALDEKQVLKFQASLNGEQSSSETSPKQPVVRRRKRVTPEPVVESAKEKAEKLKEALSKMDDPFTSIEPAGAGLPQDELDKKNVGILIDYYKNPSVNFSKKVQNAYLELFGQDKLSKIKLKKGRTRKLPTIKKEIQSKFKKVQDSQFMTVASQ